MVVLGAEIVRIDSLQNHIAGLEQKLQLLQEKVALSNDIISQSNASICNQLTATENYFAVGSIVVAVIAVILGAYITYLTYKVKKISDTTDKKIEQVTELLTKIGEKEQNIKAIESNIGRMQADVENLDRNIRTDIRGISDLFRKEDTAALFDRLVEIPEDIVNIRNMLLSREIDQSLFPKMKEAYINLKGRDEFDKYKQSYLLLMFQHFLGSTVCDDELTQDLRVFLPICMRSAWSVDMLRSTYDIVQKLATYPDKEKATTILTDYILKVEESKHAKNKEIYKIITEGSTDDTLKAIWEILSTNTPKPEHFGKQLIIHFSPSHDPDFVRKVSIDIGLSY